MIYAGIDVSKYKHDCFIISSDGEVLEDVFQFQNNLEGFNIFKTKLMSHCNGGDLKQIKVGLEATGHYSNNLINFIDKNNLPLVVFNPLIANLQRKATTLRKTKTDKIDCQAIASMLFATTKSYSNISYPINEIKSLSRHRFHLIKEQSKFKVSLTRLVDIVFPELTSIISSLHCKTVYSLLLEFPNTKYISEAHLTKLKNTLQKSSKGHFSKGKAIELKSLAKHSIGSHSESQAFELQQVIRFIQTFQQEIKLLDKRIKSYMDKVDTPVMTIPGVSYVLASIIISEIGDINNFKTPAKLLAFAGLEPSTSQSGTYTTSHARMVKRGSKYLRWSLLHAARLVAKYDPTFKAYYDKKRQEGKHYFVALSHVAKKLLRVIFHLLKNNEPFKA